MSDTPVKPCWKNRRRTMFATLAFCFVLLAYLAGWGEDSRLHDTLAFGAFALIFSIVMAYVFGAVLEDVGLFKYRK